MAFSQQRVPKASLHTLSSAAAFTKSVRSQVDAQLDSWRVRTAGISAAQATNLTPSADATDPSNSKVLTAVEVQAIFKEQLGPVLEALAEEVAHRKQAEEMMRDLNATIVEYRNDAARANETAAQLKAVLSDTQTSLRAAQDELTSLRHRVVDLEREQERNAITLPRSTETECRNAQVHLSSTELIALLHAVKGSGVTWDGMPHPAQPASAAADWGNNEQIRALRVEMAALRDELHAEIQAALRRVTGASTPEQSLDAHSVKAPKVMPRGSAFVLRDESMADLIASRKAVSEAHRVNNEDSPWITTRDTATGIPVDPRPVVDRQGAVRFTAETDDDEPPFGAVSLPSSSGGIDSSTRNAVIAYGRDVTIAALLRVEQVLQDESDGRAEIAAQEFIARDLLRQHMAASYSVAMTKTRDRLAEEQVRTARVLSASRRLTPPGVQHEDGVTTVGEHHDDADVSPLRLDPSTRRTQEGQNAAGRIAAAVAASFGHADGKLDPPNSAPASSYSDSSQSPSRADSTGMRMTTKGAFLAAAPMQTSAGTLMKPPVEDGRSAEDDDVSTSSTGVPHKQPSAPQRATSSSSSEAHGRSIADTPREDVSMRFGADAKAAPQQPQSVTAAEKKPLDSWSSGSDETPAPTGKAVPLKAPLNTVARQARGPPLLASLHFNPSNTLNDEPAPLGIVSALPLRRSTRVARPAAGAGGKMTRAVDQPSSGDDW